MNNLQLYKGRIIFKGIREGNFYFQVCKGCEMVKFTTDEIFNEGLHACLAKYI